MPVGPTYPSEGTASVGPYRRTAGTLQGYASVRCIEGPSCIVGDSAEDRRTAATVQHRQPLTRHGEHLSVIPAGVGDQQTAFRDSRRPCQEHFMGQSAAMSEGTRGHTCFCAVPPAFPGVPDASQDLHDARPTRVQPRRGSSIKGRPGQGKTGLTSLSSRYSVHLLSLSQPCLTLPSEGPLATTPVG